MDIFELKQSLEDNYESSISLFDELSFRFKDTLKTIEFITNSKYLSGATDEFGREKPYYNITNFRLNVAIRATDFDTKDITITSDTRDFVRSLLVTKEVKNWMKKTNFARTLNRMVETRPKYGGLLVKKVQRDDTVDVDVVDWRNTIFDQTNPMRSPIMENHTLTRAELAAKKDVWNYVEELLDMNEEEYEISEITGQMPNSVVDGDPNEYSIRKFFVYCEAGKDYSDGGWILFEEEKEEMPYKYVDWMNINGRVGRGVVEDCVEAQTWTNDVKLLERDAMTLAAKTGFITDDDTLENNVLTDLDNGFILKLDEGKSFRQVNTMTNALPAFDRVARDWDEQAERVTSTFEAVTGETLPSGTPFRSVAIQNQEASSLFSYRREEMGIFITEIFNDWIIPSLTEEINREHILSSEFTMDELQKIDERFSTYRANEAMKEILIDGGLPSVDEFDRTREDIRQIVAETDTTRFLEVPKGYFEDFEFKVSVITTNEQRNKAVVLESLSKILSDVSSTFNPNTGTFALLEDQALSQIFSQAVEVAGVGVSPIALSKLGQKAPSGLQGPVEEVVSTGVLSATAEEQA